MRRLVALVIGVVAASALGGCLVIKGEPTAAQQDLIGSVRVQFTICASSLEANQPGCPDFGNSGGGAGDGASGQGLVGIRVPAGTTGPASFEVVTNDDTPQTVTFTRSAEYEAELTRIKPPGAGNVWLGWRSEEYTLDYEAGDPAKEGLVSIDLGLPRSASGEPFAGPFRYRPVTGFTLADPGDPVTCEAQTECIDSPSEATVDGAPLEAPVRDLGVIPGSAPSVFTGTGGTVDVPFTIKLNGPADPGIAPVLTATTGLFGATATPIPAQVVPPGNGSVPVRVRVNVPAASLPASYQVRLRATLPNGQFREGVGRVTVARRDVNPTPDGLGNGAQRRPPRLSRLRVRPAAFRAVDARRPVARRLGRGKGARLTVRTSKRARVRFTVQRCIRRGSRPCARRRTLGGFSAAVRPPGRTLRLTGSLRGRPLAPGRYRLAARGRDSRGLRGKPVATTFRILP